MGLGWSHGQGGGAASRSGGPSLGRGRPQPISRSRRGRIGCNKIGVDNKTISDKIAQVEAENAKLKDKIERVKTSRMSAKGTGSKDAEGSETKGKLTREDIDDELAQIEQLRKENEELRRLAEERIRVLSQPEEAAAASAEPSPSTPTTSAEEEEEEEEVEEVEEAPAAPEPEEETVAAAAPEPVPDPEPEPEPEPVEPVVSEIDSHDPSEAIKDKAHFVYFTVPAQPVAGQEAVVYFNRKSSPVLRDRPSINMLLSFNGWEVSGGTHKLAPTSTPKDNYNDWWSCRVETAPEAYEMNFVFNDDEGAFENNSGQDFVQGVEGEMTRAKWQASAAQREAELEEVREAEEEEEEKMAEKQRLAQMEEEDRNQAMALVHEARSSIESLQSGAVTSVSRDGRVVVATKPATPVAGETCALVYTALGGPLQGSGQVRAHAGHNGWKSAIVVEMKKQSTFDEAEVWYAEVEVAAEAVALNIVFSNEHETYDNNSQSDYNLLVELPGEGEAYWKGVADKLQAEIKAKRLEAAAMEEERVRRREERKQKAKDYSMQVARRKVSHILHTEPSEMVAGEKVKVFYNTENTSMKGKAHTTFLRYSFNRWSHPDTFAPIKMQQSTVEEKATWVSAEIRVPEDAYMVDFVFGDSEHGDGTFDNNNELDYHLSIAKGPKSPPLYICHVAVEMAPIAKVGGLGDVVTALSRAVQEHGHHAEIILPRYDFLLASPLLNGTTFETEFDWGGQKNFVTTCMVEGVRVFFIEPSNGMFKVGSVYSTQNEDNAKFDYFCKAALEFLLQSGRQPDIIHCHDWSSAATARAYWQDYHHYGLWKPKVVFTIHNLEFGAAAIGDAAMNAQKFTTVSPSYASEVGGHPSVNPHTGKFSGIINGIDTDIWDPMDDQFLPMAYSSENAVEGKEAARTALREKLNLRRDRDCPVIGVVSRLTSQKGIHLIKHAAYRTLDRGGQFVLLGSAPDPKIQADFNDLGNQLGGDMGAFCYAYDEPLSHLIYAGCDMILVPSMFEPCGLTQMIAMRYGSVPVVRQTGGLRDTVFDVDHDKERAAWEIHGSDDYTMKGMDGTNGFSFEGTDENSLDYALNRAIDCWYNDRAFFHKLQERVMGQDWSWNKPALDYIELYYSAIKS